MNDMNEINERKAPKEKTIGNGQFFLLDGGGEIGPCYMGSWGSLSGAEARKRYKEKVQGKCPPAKDRSVFDEIDGFNGFNDFDGLTN